MPDGWREVSLGDVVALQRGHDLPTPARVFGPVPVLGSSGISGWHNEAKSPGPGLVIGRSGASIGVATFFDGPFWPLNTALYVTDFKGNDPRWMHLLLKSIDFSGFNSGSAQPSLNRNQLVNIKVLLPPPAEQQRIAAVLGALDDLIQRNEALQQDLLRLADGLFEVAPHDGDLLTFGDVCDVFGGGTPSTKSPEYWDGHIRWATPSDLTALRAPYLFETSRKLTDAGLQACSSTLHPAGSILMTSRASIGYFAITQNPAATNQGFIVVHPRREEDRWFLFHEMRSRVSEFVARANGSTFLEISRGTFKSLTVRWPTDAARIALAHRLAPIHTAAAKLQVEIDQLRATRDELLPLLMSGKVSPGEVAA